CARMVLSYWYFDVW
nr:immunoglobulin heavy chain junction region [Mus musculus]